MAATLTPDVGHNTNYSLNSFLARGGKIQVGTLAFDSSYPTGGEEVDFGFTPAFVIVQPVSGYVFEYDSGNDKVIAYYADYDAVADGALIQVADTTDLSSVSTTYLAIGI